MIQLWNVSKRFKLYRRPSDRLREWLNLGGRHETFHALRDINLHIPRGRTVGIVGQNGAGKSTLLKLITGTLLPTTGTIEINGRVAALLELGTGFHAEFTGRQNIYMNGQLLGLSQPELELLEPEIIEFSELGPFIDQPIRTYSSGMILRLGFSIAAAVNPELLIVDEALSVGDARFSQKCIRRIREFRDQGTTILFVSHDPGAVTTLCDEAILLEKGMMVSRGGPSEILEEYRALLAAKGSGNVAMKISRASGITGRMEARRHGTFQAVISRLEVCNEAGHESEDFAPDQVMVLRVRADFLADAHQPTLGFLIKDRLGLEIYGTNTRLHGIELGNFRAGESAELEVRLPLPLGYGDYSVTVALHEDETHLEACYEWTDNAAIFRIRHPGKDTWYGVVHLRPELSVRRCESSVKELREVLAQRFGDLPDPLPLDGFVPSPFLGGFGSVVDGVRAVSPGARFVCRPGSEFLTLDLSCDGEGAALSLACDGKIVGECSLNPGRNTAVFHLPSEMTGHVAIFDLTTTAAGGDQSPVLRLHGIQSSEQPQERPEWPITMSSR